MITAIGSGAANAGHQVELAAAAAAVEQVVDGALDPRPVAGHLPSG